MTTARGVADHYDELDVVYRALFGEHLHHGLWVEGEDNAADAGERMIQFIATRLGLSGGERLLDVGCGYGRMAARIAGAVSASASGITVSRRQWEQAVEGVEVRLGDWLRHSFPPGSFDAVIAVESLEHMADPELAVENVARVLRPGGRAVFGCWLLADDLTWAERLFLTDPIRHDAWLEGMTGEGLLYSRLVDAGIEVRGVDELGPRVARTWTACLANGCRLILVDRDLRRVVGSHPVWSLRLAMTMIRIIMAYRIGALRYVVFEGCKVAD